MSLLTVSLLALRPAHAETFYSPTGITLHSTTTLRADVWAGEEVHWSGRGTVTAFAPSGARHDLADGGSISSADTETGAWTFYLSDSQSTDWDLSVTRAGAEQTGRVFSESWSLGVVASGALYQTFYIPVPVDAEEFDFSKPGGRLMKAELQGLRGSDITVLASTLGLPETPLRSAPASTANTPEPALRLYLNRPQIVGDLTTTYPPDPGASLAVGFSDDTCEVVLLEELSAQLSFDADVFGLGGFVCDINGDGLDISSADGDILGDFTQGTGKHGWSWAGATNTSGAFVEPGSYLCGGGVMVGSVHVLIHGARVADPGVRLFEVVKGVAVDTQIFWNDALVEDGVNLASGAEADLHSGPDRYTGALGDASVAGENAHGWGNPSSSTSRGVDGWIATWNQGILYAAGTAEIIVLDGDLDADGDALLSSDECFTHDTDPLSNDTDSGGVDDGTEVTAGTDPLDPTDDYATPADDTGSPTDDTGGTPADDTGGTPDNGADPLSILGNFGGGALRCTSAPAAPRALLLPALLVAGTLLQRRRRRDAQDSPRC